MGKGRLISTFADQANRDASGALGTWLDYVAYEPAATAMSECSAAVSGAYETAGVQVFSSLEEVLSARRAQSIDIAVLCNVLHEVRPQDWLDTFGPRSILAELLADDGFVLFVEDYGLPVGERAHEYSFLLLDEAELMALFAVSGADVAEGRFVRESNTEPRYQGRLVAHLVAKSCLTRISESSMHAAIQTLHDRSVAALAKMLSQGLGSNARTGRSYALKAQLLANSSVWLKGNPATKIAG